MHHNDEHVVNLQELAAMYDFTGRTIVITGGAGEYLYRLKARPK